MRPLPRPGERFISQIPLGWIVRTFTLPGMATQIGVWIWYQAGLQESAVVVDVNLSRVPGVERTAAGRGLAALERAGLIVVERRPGRRLRVSIREA